MSRDVRIGVCALCGEPLDGEPVAFAHPLGDDASRRLWFARQAATFIHALDVAELLDFDASSMAAARRDGLRVMVYALDRWVLPQRSSFPPGSYQRTCPRITIAPLGAVSAPLASCVVSTASDAPGAMSHLAPARWLRLPPSPSERPVHGVTTPLPCMRPIPYLWNGNHRDALPCIDYLVDDVEELATTYPGIKAFRRGVDEFRTYARRNADTIPNYHERYRYGERVPTAFAESAVNMVVGKRFSKRQQMRWSRRGARLMLQTRTRMLDDTLKVKFRSWYRGLFHRQNAAPSDHALAA